MKFVRKKRLCAVAAGVLTAFAGWGNPAAADLIASGETLNSSAIASWPVTVQSGGTLALNSATIGTGTQTLTISGTGAGTYGTRPKGAIYSNVSGGTMGMGAGVFATVTIDGTASTLVSGGGRLRFQGAVTGGTLSTCSVDAGSETHAGYHSSFNIQKLIVAAGNFTCNGNNGSNVYFAQNHVFSEGVEVLNGGIFRLWCMQNGLNLYQNAAKTQLATITLNAGSRLGSEGGIENKIQTNVHAAGNAVIAANWANLTWVGGSLTGAESAQFTLEGDPAARLTFGSGVSVDANLQNTSAYTVFRSGSSLDGNLNITGGNVAFENGSVMSGKLTRTGTSGTLTLKSGATVNLTENSALSGACVTLSGTMNLAEGKTLTLSAASTLNAADPGTLQLAAGSQILVTKNTANTLNADVILQGNASIKLDADASTQKMAKLTVRNIVGAGKTLTFATGSYPGGAVTADSITVGKLQMSNSSDLTVNDLTGSISFFRINVFTIGNSLTLGADGISKNYSTASNCTLAFADGSTLGIQDSVSGNVSIASAYGSYIIQINGALTVNTDANQTLTWKNSAFSGKAGATNSLVKTGAGTLNLTPDSTSGISAVNLTDGVSNLSGTFTLADALSVSDGASISAGTASNRVGTLEINGDFSSEGTVLVDFNAASIDKIHVSGDADFSAPGNRVVLNWLDDAGTPKAGTDYTFLVADGGITGLDFSSIVIPEAVAPYFLGVEQVGNAFMLQFNSSTVPEPGAWVLLLLGMVFLIILTQKSKNNIEGNL